MSENNSNTLDEVLEKKKAINLEDIVLTKQWIDNEVSKVSTKYDDICERLDNKEAELDSATIPYLNQVSQNMRALAIRRVPEITDTDVTLSFSFGGARGELYDHTKSSLIGQNIEDITSALNIYVVSSKQFNSIAEIHIDCTSFKAVDGDNNEYELSPHFEFRYNGCRTISAGNKILFSAILINKPYYIVESLYTDDLTYNPSASSRPVNITANFTLTIKDIYDNIVIKNFTVPMNTMIEV